MTAAVKTGTLHDLRHYFASGLIAAGCDVVTVQHALGAFIGVDHVERLHPPMAKGRGPDAGGSGQPHGGHGRSCGLCADSGGFLSVNQR